MGRITLIARLVVKDLRRRPGQAVLLLLVITAAMGTLTLGLTLHGVTSKPYGQTKAATGGPDVVVSSVGFAEPGKADAAAYRRFAALAAAPGVTAHSGPYPVAWPVLRVHGETAEVMAEGRSQVPAQVDQPKVLQGSWVRPGGVVIERAFADALGVGAGDRVTLDGHPFRVAGIAVTAAVPVFSQVCFYGGCAGPVGQHRSFDTGLLWLTESAARSLATPDNPVTYYLNLRLADPAEAPAFAREHQPPPTSGPSAITAWQSLRAAAATLASTEQQVLLPAAWLLGLLAVATVAVVAGGRMTEQEQRVGLLKAAGAGPPVAAAILLAEHVMIALAAAGAGLAAGWLASPVLDNPGASLVGSPGAPALTWSAGLLVVAAALVVASASTLVPALRAARTSTVAMLAGAARVPRRQAVTITLSARLPIPLLLGVRLMTRRPRRALFSAASFAVTATTLVAVLTYHATAGLTAARGGQWAGPPDPGNALVSQVLLVVTVVMIVLAAVNAIFTTWVTVLDSRHFSATVRSLGATARQTAAGLSAAQLLPALAGALLGIPAGSALYGAVQQGGPQGSPSAWSLFAMVAGTLLAVAGLTALPARIGARKPAAEVLQSETA